MRIRNGLCLLAAAICMFVMAGCGSDNTMTKEQEAAVRNAKPDPNYARPTAEESKKAYGKMGEEIAKYNEAHKNDKVEFNNTPK